MIYSPSRYQQKQTIEINGIWQLSPKQRDMVTRHCSYFNFYDRVDCPLPGDIHSALLDAKIIPDLYWETQELDVQWVGQHDWVLSKTIRLQEQQLNGGDAILTLTMVETIVSVMVNGREVGSCNN